MMRERDNGKENLPPMDCGNSYDVDNVNTCGLWLGDFLKSFRGGGESQGDTSLVRSKNRDTRILWPGMSSLLTCVSFFSLFIFIFSVRSDKKFQF